MGQYIADFFEMSGPIWTSDLSGHRFNRYLRRLLRIPEEDSILTDENVRRFLHEDDRGSSLVDGADSLDPFVETEARLIRTGGEILIFRILSMKSPFEPETTVIRLLRNVTAEREQLQRLNLAQFALEKSIDPIVWVDRAGRIVFANGRFCDLVQLPKRSVIGAAVFDLVQFGDLLRWEERLAALEASGSRIRLAGVLPIDGAVVPVEVAENYLVQGPMIRVTYAFRDLRERKDLESRVEENERLTSSVLELMPLPVALIARDDGRILENNSATAEVLRLSDDEVKDRRVPDFVDDDAQRSEFMVQLEQHGRVDRFELRIRTAVSPRWMLVSGRLIVRGGNDAILVTFVEVSAHKRLEEKLRRLATIDTLTGCLNRRSFQDRGKDELERSRRQGSALSILMLDLDHFKAINDSRGHGAGDRMLRRFAEVCREVLRSPDSFGRLGGEEFGILLPDTDPRGAQTVAERIRARISELDVEYEEDRISCTVSIGIAPVVHGDATISEAIRRADAALYEAKAAGRNRTQRWKG